MPDNEPINTVHPLVIILSAIVDRHRQGKISVFEAKFEIYDEVGKAARTDNTIDKAKVSAIYLDQINQIESIVAGAQDRGEAGPDTRLNRVSGVVPARRRKRGRSDSGSESEEAERSQSNSTDDDYRESTRSCRSSKRSKTRQDPSKFVFAQSATSQFLDSISLGDNCRKTRELARVYTLDLNHAKWSQV